MFNSFYGEINGHNIYDSYDGDEPSGNYTPPNYLVFFRAKIKKTTENAVLLEIFGREKNKRGLKFVADKWVPKSQIRRSIIYTKDHQDNKEEFELGLRCIYVPFWLFEKIKDEINKSQYSIGTSDSFSPSGYEDREYMGGHF